MLVQKSFSHQSDGRLDKKNDVCDDANPKNFEVAMDYDAMIVDGSIHHDALDIEEFVTQKLPSSNEETLKVQSEDKMTKKVESEGDELFYV